MKKLTYKKLIHLPCYYCNQTGIDPIQINPVFQVVCQNCGGSKIRPTEVLQEFVVENDADELEKTQCGHLVQIDYLDKTIVKTKMSDKSFEERMRSKTDEIFRRML